VLVVLVLVVEDVVVLAVDEVVEVEVDVVVLVLVVVVTGQSESTLHSSLQGHWNVLLTHLQLPEAALPVILDKPENSPEKSFL